MSKDAKVYFDDILESIEQIEKYTNKINDKEFFKNKMIQDAVMRRLEIIGEAINLKRVWKAIKDDMPNLRKYVEQILDELDKQDSKNN